MYANLMQKKKLDRKPHEGRDDLTGEHKIGDAGQLILFFVFFVVWMVDCFVYEFSVILFQNLSLMFVLLVSIIVFFIAGYLAKTSLKIVFGEVRDKPEIINTSVYQYVRHPMYLAVILLFLSFLIFKFSLAGFIIWIIAVSFYHFIANFEEKLLFEKFGDEYEKYRQAVPMWIPKFKKLENLPGFKTRKE